MTILSSDIVRRINLIEVLTDEAEAEGRDVPPLPELAAHDWTEGQIRQHFALQNATAAPQLLPKLTPCISFSEPNEADFRRWFPGLALSKTECCTARLRVLCFPNAGNAEDMYTNEGTGIRRAPSPLLEWCRANDAECMAVQPPGRNLRSKEPCITSPQQMATALLPIVAAKLASTPYVVIAHSVGTWNAYELLCTLRAHGIQMPLKVFFSAMASPDIPVDKRPWRQQRSLNEPDFKDECRGWDVNEVVFSPGLWPTYHGLMRADFTLFDEYTFIHQGEAPFTFPMTTFYGSRDRRISAGMVADWQPFTSGAFTSQQIDGHHLWPLDKAAKQCWLDIITKELSQLELPARLAC